jgi:hypothetical protein
MKKVMTVNGLTIWERSSREMADGNQRYAIFLPGDKPSTADPDWEEDVLAIAEEWCQCYYTDEDIPDDTFDPEKPCKDNPDHECDPDCPYLGTDMCSEDDI